MSKLPSPFVFSQSSLQDYFDCPRRFELRHISRLNWPAEEAEPALENERRQQEGMLFHRLAQQYLLGMPSERLSRLAASPDLSRWWENFQAGFHDPKGLGKLYPEITLSAPIGNHRLLAKFDLVTIRDDQVSIYDWKTYHKRPRNEWMAVRLQTRVYRYLLSVAGASLNNGRSIPPQNIEMIYWYTDYPNEAAVFRYDQAQFSRDASGLEKLVTEIEGLSEFILTDDQGKCRYCPYRSYCKRGGVAGDWHDAEAEAENMESFDINFEQIGEIAF